MKVKIICGLSFGIVLSFIGMVIGTISGASVGGNNDTGFEFMGEVGYEATGYVGLIVGGVLGMVLGVWLGVMIARKKKDK